MQQHVDDKFFQGGQRHFQIAFRVEPLFALQSPQIAGEKRHRPLVQIAQASFDILAVPVLVAGRIVADEGDGLDDEGGAMPLRMPTEYQEAGEIECRIPGQTEIVQQLAQRNSGLFERRVKGLPILLLEETAKMLQVYVSGRGSLDGHFVRMNKIGALKHPLDLLARSHPALVRSRLHPEYAIVVGVWLGDALRNGDDHDQLTADVETFSVSGLIEGRTKLVAVLEIS